jgi:hypothetical protein
MLGGYTCPRCGTINACPCDGCKEFITPLDIVGRFLEDGNGVLCGLCNRAFSFDQAVEEEGKSRRIQVDVFFAQRYSSSRQGLNELLCGDDFR